MSQDTTLREVIAQATEEGTWVNAPFEVVVHQAKPKNGKAPSKADIYQLGARGVQATLVSFDRSLVDYTGSRLRIAPKGIKAKMYKGAVEITVGKDTGLTVQGDAPVDNSAPPPQGAQREPAKTAAAQDRPPANRTTEDPENTYHKGMKKLSLGWLHAYQYGCDISVKVKGGLPPEQFQACVSSIFIEANKQGLNFTAPKLREANATGGGFVQFTKAAVDPRIAEEEAKHKAEEAAKVAAEEARKKAAVEAERRRAENLDEDVPF